jgi:hypothetical protein
MKTTKRIDSGHELSIFLYELMAANIEIPSNITLEIDSPSFESEINEMAQNFISEEKSIPMKRFEYMGNKVVFKSE